ncbi:MAG: hypothetical protein H0W90_16385 [Actinobacteria bacterium]|nr:hypothetical protein [Actinomycetota bacterium]
MADDIDVNRFALMAILENAHAKRPAAYPDFETLNAMSDSGLFGYARGLLYSLEQSSPSTDEVAEELRDGLSSVVGGKGENPSPN